VPIIIEQKIFKMPSFFLAPGCFQSVQFFWADKKINLYSFPSQAKISKIAQIFSKHIGKEI
jgi:hypothetical protein